MEMKEQEQLFQQLYSAGIAASASLHKVVAFFLKELNAESLFFVFDICVF